MELKQIILILYKYLRKVEKLPKLFFEASVSFGEGNGPPLQYSCLENPWMEELGGLQSMGSLGVGHD